MSRLLNRRTIGSAAVTIAVLAALTAFASGGRSDVTKARLERSLPATFSNIYLQQAKLLGHKGLTVQSLHARASCDKGGPNVADRGPGADWICLMAWSDPNVPLPDGNAKFELNVHSNDCYTAGGPTKFVGALTITDARGRDVTNPAFEFDSCFDPKSSNAPTGVDFAKPASASLTPTQQAAASASLTLPSGTMAADGSGAITPTLSCSVGKDGCGGTLTATAAGRTFSTTYALATDDHQPITLPLPKGTTGPVRLQAAPVIGTAPRPTSTVAVTAGGR
jgi:hypothetical protein